VIEINTTKRIGGRDMRGIVDTSKSERRDVVRDALEGIRRNADVRIGSASRITSARGRAYNTERGCGLPAAHQALGRPAHGGERVRRDLHGR
jgi:hypothetical protein